MPLWHNSKINLEYRKDWEEKGYLTLGDILNDDGHILSENELKERGLGVNFLDYYKMNKRIKEITNKCGNKKIYIGPCLSRILFEIGLNVKGCNQIYNKIMVYDSNIILEVKDKWEQILNTEIPHDIVENGLKL